MKFSISLKKESERAILFLVILGFFIVGCSQNESGNVLTPTIEKQLIPHLTATLKLTTDSGDATQTITPTPNDFHAPTTTPFVYEVVENDTLTGIAFRHSVQLQDLIAANPGIDPNFLTIGLTLTIPLDGVVSAALPTPTPVSITFQPPVCYSLLNGSIHCMAAFENDQTFAVENVIVMISLQSIAGNDLVSQIALTPLNIIPAGQKAAVSTSFFPPLPQDFVAQTSLLSVIPVSPDDQRYLQTEFQIQKQVISPDGKRVSIMGTLEILPEQPTPGTVWVSAYAYDKENNIVGIRKWIADDVLKSGEGVNFEFDVYSLGPAIDHVDILTETRP